MSAQLKDFFIARGHTENVSQSKKLPLVGIVLQRMYFFRIQKIVSENLSTRELCSRIFFNELKPVWGRAYIPIKPGKNCIDQLVHLHKE